MASIEAPAHADGRHNDRSELCAQRRMPKSESFIFDAGIRHGVTPRCADDADGDGNWPMPRLLKRLEEPRVLGRHIFITGSRGDGISNTKRIVAFYAY